MRKEAQASAAFLLHAVLAISFQHLAKKTKTPTFEVGMRHHQALALRLFSEALSDKPSLQLLDTIMLLINFEASHNSRMTYGS